MNAKLDRVAFPAKHEEDHDEEDNDDDSDNDPNRENKRGRKLTEPTKYYFESE